MREVYTHEHTHTHAALRFDWNSMTLYIYIHPQQIEMKLYNTGHLTDQVWSLDCQHRSEHIFHVRNLFPGTVAVPSEVLRDSTERFVFLRQVLILPLILSSASATSISTVGQWRDEQRHGER